MLSKGRYKIDTDILIAICRNGIKSSVVIKKWRRFLFSLLHPHLAELHVPSHFFMEIKQIKECLNFLENIGAKCSGLRLLEAKADQFKLYDEPPDMRLERTFFWVLPKLANLQVVRIQFFYSGDWALQQFGQYGTNFV
jgi:hypothetical protein